MDVQVEGGLRDIGRSGGQTCVLQISKTALRAIGKHIGCPADILEHRCGPWRGGMIGVLFFQAEDGIRDIGVTGVQTCALPIFRFRKTNRAPEKGSCRITSVVIRESPSNPRLMSAGRAARKMRTEGGQLSIPGPPGDRKSVV